MIQRISLSLALVAGLLVALACDSRATSVDVWAFSIWEDPEPPLSKVPPLLQHSSRNKDLLKYQIPGIIAGYIGFVILIFTFIFAYGRRMRHTAQSAPALWSREMVKPMKTIVAATPVSPASFRNWTRWGRAPKSSQDQTQTSPTQASVVSFNPAVIEADKGKMDAEMERIYAHVMAEEVRAPRSITSQDQEAEAGIPQSPSHTRAGSISSRSFSQRRPPQLQAQNQALLDDQQTAPTSPISQRGVRAIYPSSASVHDPYSQQTPLSATFPQTPASLYSVPPTVPFSPLSDNTAQGSERASHHSRKLSNASNKSRTTRSVRNLRISPPMPHNQNISQPQQDDATAPSSRRNYDSSPPLVSPPLRSPTPIEDHSSDEDDETDAIVDTHRRRPVEDEDRDTEDIIHAYSYTGLDSPRPAPAPAPQRQRFPVIPSIQTQTTSGGVGTASAPLPFRAYTAIQPPPMYTHQAPSHNVTAPTPTRTTFLSPRQDRFAPGRLPGGLNSANALSPMRTGNSVLYSPYMPFTPVTPVTPHLVTRNERRAREREERRMGGGMPTAIDEVVDESEMWGDGW